MKAGVTGILVLGCLMAVLIVGCQIPNGSSPNSSNGPFTNEVLVTQSGQIYSAPKIISRPYSFLYDFGTNQPTSPVLKKYSFALISTIYKDWRKRMDENHLTAPQHGEVVIVFQLHSNGNVSDIHAISSTAGVGPTALGELTIGLNAPYPPWPDDMLKTIGKPSMKITIKFQYEH
jgi:hypothetical protein